MPLQVDIDPLKAMELFYQGEKLGVWEGEFVKNEKKRGLVYPHQLKEFLQKYGYFGVNIGDGSSYLKGRFWLPDDVRIAGIDADGEYRDLIIAGSLRELYVGFFADDCGKDDIPIAFGKEIQEQDGSQIISFGSSSLYLRDILICLFTGNLLNAAKGAYYEADAARPILQKYGSSHQLNELMTSALRPYRFICYDDEEEKFICVDLYKDKEAVAVFSPHLTDDELESLFKKEFYENSMNCDFAHALRLLEKIIDRLEQDNKSMTLEAGEKYRLAARCCWVLKQWDKAEEWLKKAEPIFNLKSTPAEKAMYYYQGLGNFYSDKGDKEKSLAAYQREEQLAKENGISPFRSKGDRLMRQGIELTKQDRLEEAIELFEQALEQYKQDPKGCKYDIARCGQLKGDAKHTLKERQKNGGK